MSLKTKKKDGGVKGSNTDNNKKKTPRKKRTPRTEHGITVPFLITREFQSADEFSTYIMGEASRRSIGFMETLLEYCERREIDTLAVGSLLTPDLKEKIEGEARTLNLLHP